MTGFGLKGISTNSKRQYQSVKRFSVYFCSNQWMTTNLETETGEGEVFDKIERHQGYLQRDS